MFCDDLKLWVKNREPDLTLETSHSQCDSELPWIDRLVVAAEFRMTLAPTSFLDDYRARTVKLSLWPNRPLREPAAPPACLPGAQP